ncbi:ovomucoid-like [Heliangelus exortis]|uniref:ovomucoid-like n=1 Tax=Heliangelus exortis TaxID=472823 RepID=UPI003A9589F1
MKPASVLLLLALALCCITATDAQREYCRSFRVPRPMCSMEYMPHCGSDGQTYANKCMFCNAFVRSRRTLRLRALTAC